MLRRVSFVTSGGIQITVESKKGLVYCIKANNKRLVLKCQDVKPSYCNLKSRDND